MLMYKEMTHFLTYILAFLNNTLTFANIQDDLTNVATQYKQSIMF